MGKIVKADTNIILCSVVFLLEDGNHGENVIYIHIAEVVTYGCTYAIRLPLYTWSMHDKAHILSLNGINDCIYYYVTLFHCCSSIIYGFVNTSIVISNIDK